MNLKPSKKPLTPDRVLPNAESGPKLQGDFRKSSDAIDPLEDVLDKMVSVGLLKRKQEMFTFGPSDLDSALPALHALTREYGQLEGYEAEVLARIPPLLFVTGPLSLALIRMTLEESGIYAERRA